MLHAFVRKRIALAYRIAASQTKAPAVMIADHVQERSLDMPRNVGADART